MFVVETWFLLLHVFMKKRKRKKKNCFNGKDAESLFSQLLLPTMHAMVPGTHIELSDYLHLYLVNGSASVLHRNSQAIRNIVLFCKFMTCTKALVATCGSSLC